MTKYVKNGNMKISYTFNDVIKIIYYSAKSCKDTTLEYQYNFGANRDTGEFWQYTLINI